MNPLSNAQKQCIAIAARKAYLAWQEREAFEAINDHLSVSKCFEAWRHVEQGKATGGLQSLTLCTSEAHFLPLLAHFRLEFGTDVTLQQIAPMRQKQISDTILSNVIAPRYNGRGGLIFQRT